MKHAKQGLFSHPSFNAEEFSRRWRSARMAALLGGCPGASSASTEVGLLREANASLQPVILRALFLNSHRLAAGMVRFFGRTARLGELAELLGLAGAPCFSGDWKERGDALELRREGCNSRACEFECDYWREAADAIVAGAGVRERLSRHKSIGHGDSECVDLLFLDGPAASGKFGPLPEGLREDLAPFVASNTARDIELTLLGVSEGVLHYRLNSASSALCGAGGGLLHASLRAELARIRPGLKIMNVAPQVVLGERR